MRIFNARLGNNYKENCPFAWIDIETDTSTIKNVQVILNNKFIPVANIGSKYKPEFIKNVQREVSGLFPKRSAEVKQDTLNRQAEQQAANAMHDRFF